MATIPGLRNLITEAEDLSAATANALAAQSANPSASSSRHNDVAYDGKKREPQFANAQNSCLWELVRQLLPSLIQFSFDCTNGELNSNVQVPLLNHYHPSVALHATQLLSGVPISASTDLEQHSLNHFLDRFVYREVKKNAPTKGSSMMQSGVAGQDKTGRISLKKGPARGDDAVVNSDVFRNKDIAEVPVDQLFFHKYFSSKTAQGDSKAKASKKRKNRKGKDSDSDDESIADLGHSDLEEDILPPPPTADDDDDDDEAEEEIWKAMKASMPKKAGEEDDGMSEDDLEDEDDDADVAEFDYSDSEAGPSDDEEGGADDVPFKSAFGDDEDQFDEDSDGDNLIEDDADLLGSDEDMPMFGDEEEKDTKGRSKKKRKLGALPMFASADDYKHLLGGDSDGDDGEGADMEL